MLLNKIASLFLISGMLTVSSVSGQTWTGLENWKYIPLDTGFWNDFENRMKKPNTTEALEFVLSKSKDKDIDTIEEAEYYVALADSLVNAGYKQAAFNIYLNLIKKHPGTFLSQKSLIAISSLVASDSSSTEEFDEEELSRIINQAAFKDVPDATLEMLNYFSGFDDLRRKLTKWSYISLKSLQKEDYWSDRLRFYNAIQTYAQNNLEQAEKELKELAEKPGLSAKLKWRVQLQRARILFEQKKFLAADEIYSKTDFPARIFGKVLLERAWSQFYLKEYSTALGLLESLKAPSFNYASDPEQTILAMVIYREVCHYPKVTSLAAEFQKKFARTFQLINQNRPLKDNLVLVWQTIQKPGFRESSDVIDAIVKERERFKSVVSIPTSSKAGKLIYSLYQQRQNDLEKRLERFMQKDLRHQANSFLVSWDQIKLADYISRLDENRIKPLFENRRYVANTEEMKSFNILYWPVSGEYWKEEFKNYQVLLSDRCDGSAATASTGAL